MKKHPNSPHLSVKRLRELAEDFVVSNKITTKESVRIFQFLTYVSFIRPSLTSKHVKK